MSERVNLCDLCVEDDDCWCGDCTLPRKDIIVDHEFADALDDAADELLDREE